MHRTVPWLIVLACVLQLLAPGTSNAQVPIATTFVPAAPVVGFVPERRGLFGLRTVYRPVVGFPAAAPVTVARPVIVSRPVTVARPVIVTQPVTTYYAPAAPTTTYYAPAAPTTTYYAPAAPTTTYYAPAAPTYYAPAAPAASCCGSR